MTWVIWVGRFGVGLAYLGFAVAAWAFSVRCLEGDWGLAALNLFFIAWNAYFVGFNTWMVEELRS